MSHIKNKAARPLTDADLSAPALKAFFNITDKWGLSDADRMLLLGNPGRTTFYKWKADASSHLPKDTLERISYILGIHKALRLLFSNTESLYGWIKHPNKAPLFGGKSALNRMLSGNVSDLFIVREYLDYQRGGWA